MDNHNHKENNEKTKEVINAVGAIAEMSLVFFRAALGAGANLAEATKLTQAYIAAMITASMNRGNETHAEAEDEPDEE